MNLDIHITEIQCHISSALPLPSQPPLTPSHTHTHLTPETRSGYMLGLHAPLPSASTASLTAPELTPPQSALPTALSPPPPPPAVVTQASVLSRLVSPHSPPAAGPVLMRGTDAFVRQPAPEMLELGCHPAPKPESGGLAGMGCVV